ncbi:MAG: hypothetical protein QF752_13470 [Planctomycetota bacterium]|nr:hypothetical protein [Planctomycetota bacterium]
MSRLERALRVLAILITVPVIAAFGVWRAGGLPDLKPLFSRFGQAQEVPATRHPGFQGLAVGKPMISSVGEASVRTQLFVSALSPSSVIDGYSSRFQENNLLKEAVRRLPAQSKEGRMGRWVAENNPQSFRVDSPYCSIIGARDASGRDVGVIAYPSPEGDGGSIFYVMETIRPAGVRGSKSSGPIDPRNRIPAPPFSRRRFRLGGLGEPGSTLSLYLSRIGRTAIVSHYEQELGELGWVRESAQDRILNRELRAGHAILFRRGPQEVLIHLKEWSRGVEGVTILFRNKIR